MISRSTPLSNTDNRALQMDQVSVVMGVRFKEGQSQGNGAQFHTALSVPEKKFPGRAFDRSQTVADSRGSLGVKIRVCAAVADISAIDERKHTDRGVM